MMMQINSISSRNIDNLGYILSYSEPGLALGPAGILRGRDIGGILDQGHLLAVPGGERPFSERTNTPGSQNMLGCLLTARQS